MDARCRAAEHVPHAHRRAATEAGPEAHEEPAMFRPVVPSLFLRRVLWADAAVSAVVGLLMAAAASWLASFTGLPAALLVPAGLALLPYAAYLVWLATRSAVPAGAVWVPIVLNGVWAVDCVGWIAAGLPAPAAPGIAFLVVQALTVLVFAELQFIGLRRAAPAAA